MLLSIVQIQQGLQERFTPLLEDMPELDVYLLKMRAHPCRVARIEEALRVRLPLDFRAFVSAYDLDDFTLGPISFGIDGSYLDHLLELNLEPGATPWWSTAQRPEHQLVIATSDPYAIVLDCAEQKVYAITDTPTVEDAKPVALSFELFLRGIGTRFLLEADSEAIRHRVGALHADFWLQI